MTIALTGCGAQNESALSMNTAVTNQVTNTETGEEQKYINAYRYPLLFWYAIFR